jgi:hypothetical protein
MMYIPIPPAGGPYWGSLQLRAGARLKPGTDVVVPNAVERWPWSTISQLQGQL